MVDCDGDGVNDVDEQEQACIQDPKCTLTPLDSDNDGIYDKDELAQCVNNPDCDGDGIPDGSETRACILMADCDGDGVSDKYETTKACVQDPSCTPAGLSKEDRELGQLIDLIDR